MGSRRDQRRATRRARRELGLTFFGIAQYLKAIKEDGELRCEDVERAKAQASRLAAQVLNRAIETHPNVSLGEGIDWDAILEFLEKLIPIIMRIIAIFAAF